MRPAESLPLVIFVSPVCGSEPERWVRQACRANTLDLIDRAAQVPYLRPILVATTTDGWEQDLACLPVEVVPDPPARSFHFGQCLCDVVARYNFSRVFYIGGGMGALMAADELAALAARALALERGVVTNNLFSADLVALAPTSALASIDPPARDNDLAWRLGAAGLPVESLPATAATRLDLDTPNDLTIAILHPACGPALRRLAEGLPLPVARVRQVAAELHNSRGEVLVYGRVAAATWARLEQLPCQTRIFSEERGMHASERQERREVRAWLGAFLQHAGPRAFFRSLATACTAAVLDTRVLFAHLGLSPLAADRFYSDLLQPGEIADPAVRSLTEEALAAPVPLLLGGQALVSGGLLALADIPGARR